jgi:hypothetical protein
MTRHKARRFLYWSGPPESKTRRLVLRFVLLARSRCYMAWIYVPEVRPLPSYIGRRTRSVDRSPNRLQQGNLSLVCLHHGRLIRVALIRLDWLVLHAKLSSRLGKVVWGIFWKVFRRSCGLPTRSVGPTDRSAGLLVCRIHLSGTVVSLVSGDPGVPMYHKPPSEVALRP